MPLKMGLGGSWAPFGRGLGRSGPSFGHFWTLVGRFFCVLNSTFFKHGSAWAQDGLQEASGIDFGSILEGFGKDFGRFWEGLGAFSQAFLCWDPRAVSRSPAERLNANVDAEADADVGAHAIADAIVIHR